MYWSARKTYVSEKKALLLKALSFGILFSFFSAKQILKSWNLADKNFS